MSRVPEIRDRDLVRYLVGEMDAADARRVSLRLAEDPGLARRYASLRATWNRLELPPDESPGPELSRQILRRVSTGASGSAWRPVPVWARAAAGLALPLGVVLGLLLSGSGTPLDADAAGTTDLVSALGAEDPEGLAASYYESMLDADPDPSEGSS